MGCLQIQYHLFRRLVLFHDFSHCCVWRQQTHNALLLIQFLLLIFLLIVFLSLPLFAFALNFTRRHFLLMRA